MNEIIELKTIQDSPEEWEALEKRLKKFFLDEIYKPMVQEINLPKSVIKNAANKSPLLQAIFEGTVVYDETGFSGTWNAQISKELKHMGATFDRKSSRFHLDVARVPTAVKQMAAASKIHWERQLAKLDVKLKSLLPKDLTKVFKCKDLFDKSLWKAEKSFQKNVKNIAVIPKLHPQIRERIAAEWEGNMELWIKDWTQEQINGIRQKIFKEASAGARRSSFVPSILEITKTVQGSYDEALSKAKFLAHQETRLMMSTYKQARYEAAGSRSYLWRCVHRPKDTNPKKHIPGNVRYSHGLLDGKEFKWSNPPITTNPGEPSRRNHPGADYRCRCFSRPLIRRSKWI